MITMQNSTTNIDALFIVVLMSQIMLFSWYYPKKITAVIKRVIEKFPPSEYPRLYTKPLEYYHKKLDTYKDLTILSLIACLLIVMVSWTLGNSINEEMLVVFIMISQSMPFSMLIYTATKHQQLMKISYNKTNKGISRKAELRPRRLFDFVSQRLVVVAAFLYCAYIIINLLIHDFALFSKDEVIISIVGITFLQVYFLAIVYWKMHGKKQNPYLDDADRINEIKTVVRIAVYTSIAASVFLIISSVMDEFKYLDAFDPLVLSVYFQLMVILSIGTEIKSVHIKDMNFDVYKQNSQTDTTAI